MASDLLRQALRPRPVEVTAGRHAFLIPATDAAGWMECMLADDLEFAVLPGLLDSAQADLLEDLLCSGELAPLDLRNAAYRAITAAGGRDWWEVVRLCLAADQPNVLGELVLHGVDPAGMPLARWVAAVYALLTRNLDEKGLMKFQTKIMLVPDIEGLEVDELPSDAAEVMAMLRAMPGASIGG